MSEKLIEVLVSTMDRKDLNFLKKMNLSTDAVVVNQNHNLKGNEVLHLDGQKINWINSLERGLSKSRNIAIENATADICMIADDDMTYHSDYKEKVLNAYKEYPEADIIAFQVKRVGNPDRGKNFREKMNWENYITSMKISSVEITFRRETIINKNLFFNPHLGAGTEFSNGEENAFLYDALRKECKILYLPVEIAEVDMSESSWFEGFTESYFETVGAKFYNMTTVYYKLLILQFGIRKYPLYKDEISLIDAFKFMRKGVEKYKAKYEDKT